MIILAGAVRIAPGRRADALPHILRMVAATRAEPGCMAYAFAFDVNDDHLVRIFEIYRDQAAVDAHRAAPHFATWRACWDEAGVSDRDMTFYEVSNHRKA